MKKLLVLFLAAFPTLLGITQAQAFDPTLGPTINIKPGSTYLAQKPTTVNAHDSNNVPFGLLITGPDGWTSGMDATHRLPNGSTWTVMYQVTFPTAGQYCWYLGDPPYTSIDPATLPNPLQYSGCFNVIDPFTFGNSPGGLAGIVGLMSYTVKIQRNGDPHFFVSWVEPGTWTRTTGLIRIHYPLRTRTDLQHQQVKCVGNTCTLSFYLDRGLTTDTIYVSEDDQTTGTSMAKAVYWGEAIVTIP